MSTTPTPSETNDALHRGNVGGYTSAALEACDETYNAGFSVYSTAWPLLREYLAPPSLGALADIEPALILTPPAGLEVGYVPIATRQGMEQP